MGRPVSSFDIGGLIGDVREEQRRQKGARPKQQTLIGSLIQDAMMSFRSLTEQDPDPSLNPAPEEQSGVGAIPLSFGTFESSHSGTRAPKPESPHTSFAPGAGYPSGNYGPGFASGNYEAGNLAALEDHAADSQLDMGHAPRAPASQRGGYGYDPMVLAPGHPQSRPSHARISYPTPAQAPPRLPQRPTKLPLTYWLVTATLVAVGAAVGAYLAGVFS
jgi:hypothetical protein